MGRWRWYPPGGERLRPIQYIHSGLCLGSGPGILIVLDLLSGTTAWECPYRRAEHISRRREIWMQHAAGFIPVRGRARLRPVASGPEPQPVGATCRGDSGRRHPVRPDDGSRRRYWCASGLRAVNRYQDRHPVAARRRCGRGGGRKQRRRDVYGPPRVDGRRLRGRPSRRTPNLTGGFGGVAALTGDGRTLVPWVHERARGLFLVSVLSSRPSDP
jgi:hypothetical protein